MASTRFHVLLEERIREEGDKIRNSIANGAIADYPDYRWHVGCLYGLKMCLKLCDDIDGEFDERNHSA
jgi:hypothetical protein